MVLTDSPLLNDAEKLNFPGSPLCHRNEKKSLQFLMKCSFSFCLFEAGQY